jgi:peptide/nickel transport system ATP-binding protein
LCDEVVVLRRGQVVEAAPTQSLFEHPQNDYTRTLIQSMPDLAF